MRRGRDGQSKRVPARFGGGAERPVRSRRELSAFIKLPWRLYCDEPNWVAPLVLELRKRLDQRKNPFFEHAEAQYFLAYRDGRPIGRISAHIDRNFNEFQDNEWGLFGWFECEDDPEAARALLDAAEGWLRERGRVLGYVADSDAAALRAAGAEVFEAMEELPGMLGFS